RDAVRGPRLRGDLGAERVRPGGGGRLRAPQDHVDIRVQVNQDLVGPQALGHEQLPVPTGAVADGVADLPYLRMLRADLLQRLHGNLAVNELGGPAGQPVFWRGRPWGAARLAARDPAAGHLDAAAGQDRVEHPAVVGDQQQRAWVAG